ncbi:Hsp20/alpha crystallin family protein [uncultured bacterium]|uniref:Hsp20/alpha crystallin family protein n=2 Tax=Acetilactobacillus jinshanensis TaxID=1720083 RepID=A0A4P6ZPJ3_9LACO|nr:Hsp20/alpha crystallin family protein [Acetilactobacillus jinshanensis]URL61861.1 Hsp20/alpha crystallin family protein [uncultured bacterium]
MTNFDDDFDLGSMNDFFGDLDKSFFNAMPKMNPMKTDVTENKKNYQVTAELPGFKKNQIHMDYRHNTLRIHAVHNVSRNVKNNKGKVLRSERSMSNVNRAFYLPNVKFNKISASYDGGLLKVTLPKAAKKIDNSHRISIK